MANDTPKAPTGLLVVASLVVILWGAKAAGAFFVPLLLAATLAFMAVPLVRALRRLRFPDWLAVTAAAVALTAPLAAAAVGLVQQAQALASDYPRILEFIDRELAALSHAAWIQHLGFGGRITIADVAARITEQSDEGLQLAAAALQLFATTTSEAILVFVFALFMLASRDHFYRTGLAILARWEGIQAKPMLDAVSTLIQEFLLSRLIVGAAAFVASALALWWLDISYAFLLGSVVGVMTLIPSVGFAISLVPVILVAVATGAGLQRTGAALAALILIHLVEANVLTPKLIGRRLNLNALATIVGLFAGGLLWGIWGMFLSVPILGIVRIVFSVSPEMMPWGELLAERQDRELTSRLVTRRVLEAMARSKRLARLKLQP